MNASGHKANLWGPSPDGLVLSVSRMSDEHIEQARRCYADFATTQGAPDLKTIQDPQSFLRALDALLGNEDDVSFAKQLAQDAGVLFDAAGASPVAWPCRK